MEYYRVFVKALLKEIDKHNLNTNVLYSKYVTNITASLAENFDAPYYRCAYMFRYATGSTYFFNYCIKEFLSGYSNTKDIFSLWKSYSDVKVCSLSIGPGLDYLGFLLAILEYDPSPPNFNSVKIISKYGAWKHTVNFILEVFREQGTPFGVASPNLKYENVDVIQADLLKNYSGISKIWVNEAVSEASIVLMMKTLNLSDVGTPKQLLLHMLKDLIFCMKSEAIIFCIDTKPSVDLLTQALSHFPGKFLHGPIHETVMLPADFPLIAGCRPVISMRGAFFAWQKLSMSAHLNICTTPLKNISVITNNSHLPLKAPSASDDESNASALENKVLENTSVSTNNSHLPLQAPASNGDKSNYSALEDKAKTEDNVSDSNLDPPWTELKSFWKCSSPKRRELLKSLILTKEESLEQDIESSKIQKTSLNITQTPMLGVINVIPPPTQNQMQNSLYHSTSLQNTLDKGNTSDSVGTLNSVSSFTCEDDSLSNRIEERSTGTIPKNREVLPSFHTSVKDKYTKVNSAGNTLTVDSAKTRSCENKLILTNTHQDIPTGSSSVEALTEKIRHLEISLEILSQQNKLCNYGDKLHNHQTEGLHNVTNPTFSCTVNKPCSKQSPSCGFKNQNSMPSCESDDKKKFPFQNAGCHYNCQCFHNRCSTHCCSRSCNFQPLCAPQPVRSCNFSCNRPQSIENNLGNLFTSPTIVIPVQHISNNTLLQIISDLQSELKNK